MKRVISVVLAVVTVTGVAAPAAADRGRGRDPFEAALAAVGQDTREASNPEVWTFESGVVTRAALATPDRGLLVIAAEPDAAATVLERVDGAQVLVALEAGDRAASFTFGGVAADLVALPDGGVAVIDAGGQPVGQVLAPWAVDAAGVAVATEYEIDGMRLVQHVHPGAGTVYPVVADPYVSSKFSWGLWTHVFSRDLTAKMASDAAAVAVILLKFIPTAGPIIAAMAGIIYIAARNANNKGACLLLRALATPGNIYWAGSYTGSRCRAK